MKMLVMNRKITLSILMMIVLVCSFQGVNRVAEAVTVPEDPALSDLFAASGNDNLFQALLDRATRLCEGLEFPRDTFAVNEAHTVLVGHTSAGIGLVMQGNFRSEAGGSINFGWLTFVPRGDVRVLTRYAPSGTSITCMLDEPLQDSTSVVLPLTETTLDWSVVTLTLQEHTYEQDISKIRDAVTVSGITGVTIDTATVQRLSDTEITVALTFDGTDFDEDVTLTFNVASGAIAAYTGDAFIAEVPVTAVKEVVSASVVSPLTEATLDESIITLTLTGAVYEGDISKIRDAVTVSGITGVTVNTSQVRRLSDRRVSVQLDYDGTDFDTDSSLTFTIISEAIANHNGNKLTTEIPVTAIVEVVAASVVSPLTEETLDGSIVTLTLTGAVYEGDISKIRDAVTVSGITGVTVNTSRVRRLSDRRVSVQLYYDGTDFDTDSSLTFTIISEAIANHNGNKLTTEIPVTAIVEVVAASVVSPLTEETLDGSIVTLTLTGSVYEQDLSKIRDAVTVSGINGVTVDTTTVRRLGDTIVAIELDYDDTDFFRDTAMIFNVAADAITNYIENALITQLPVTASRNESLLMIFWTDRDTDRIHRANLDGSNVEDLVTQGLETPNGIALDVAAGKMYWTDGGTDKIHRANLDGSNIEDLVTQGLEWPKGIALDVAAGKMYWTDGGTNKIQRANLDGSNIEDLVTQGLWWPGGIALDVEAGKMYWTDYGTDKIQRANLDGSNIEDLVTQGLRDPNGIALGIFSPVNPITEIEEPTITKEDVNGDGVVDVQDLAQVGLQYGKTGTNAADVNGDKVVNVDDLILVAAAVDAAAAAAPAARAQVHSHFTASQLQGWLTEARASGNTSHTYQQGIAVLEHLLALVAPEETALLAN